MANNRRAFGLCKKWGIKLPDNATPRDAWEALKERGVYLQEPKEDTVVHPKDRLEMDYGSYSSYPTVYVEDAELFARIMYALGIRFVEKATRTGYCYQNC